MVRIRGSLSSTLGQLFTGLDQGERLSSLVREAIQTGVAEPDPREDLSGRDLARTALILARTAGWNVECSDVSVESLYPESMDTIEIKEFISQLSSLDISIQARNRRARENAAHLRYILELSSAGIRVGLSEVEDDDPLAHLRGSEQFIAIETPIYQETPLVIQGRGGGVEATASGMLSDIVELCGLNRHDDAPRVRHEPRGFRDSSPHFFLSFPDRYRQDR